MKNAIPPILHVDTGRQWRGGQQQALYLHEGLCGKGVASTMVTPPGSPMQERCLSRGLPVVNLPLRGEWDLVSAWKLAGMLGQPERGILQAHDAHALSLCLLAATLKPARVIGVRRVDFTIGRGWFSRWKYTSSRVDRVICISEAIRRVMQGCGVPGDKLGVIRSAIDPDRFAAAVSPPGFRRRWDVPDDHLIVGTVAAFVGHKDYPNLIRAARHVLDRFPAATFFAVGSGAGEAAARELAGELGVLDRFRFTGQQEDVGAFLKSFDLFVQPSKMEGLGTSVLDAMSVGLPVVGTDAGGIPEMIDSGCDGLIVPRQNSLALGLAIVSLLEDTRLRETMRLSARQKAQVFSAGNLVERYLNLYQEITTGR